MPKFPNPLPRMQTQAVTQVPEPKPTDDRPVNIPLDDVTVAVTETNQPSDFMARMGTKQGTAVHSDAEAENRKFDFTRELIKARTEKAAKEYTAPPIPEGIQRQTNSEMEAGRKAVAARAEQDALRPRKKVDDGGTTMQSVFRPADYIPDPKKGQGLVPNITARSLGS